MVYKWYILPIGVLYATYQLLGEPETTIDITGKKGTSQSIMYFLRLTVRSKQVQSTLARQPEESRSASGVKLIWLDGLFVCWLVGSKIRWCLPTDHGYIYIQYIYYIYIYHPTKKVGAICSYTCILNGFLNVFFSTINNAGQNGTKSPVETLKIRYPQLAVVFFLLILFVFFGTLSS